MSKATRTFPGGLQARAEDYGPKHFTALTFVGRWPGYECRQATGAVAVHRRETTEEQAQALLEALTPRQIARMWREHRVRQAREDAERRACDRLRTTPSYEPLPEWNP